MEPQAPPARSRPSPITLAVAAATLWAAFVRFFRLNALPPPAWFDEVWFALRARELLHGGPPHVFYKTGFGGANAGLVYLTALVQRLGIDTITSARIAPAVAGTLAVPLAYACLRELLRDDARSPRPAVGDNPGALRLAAMLTGLVLAYTLFHVTAGRTGMEVGIAPATALLVIWQMMRAIRRQAWSGWLAAGLVAGLAQYNGPHARFVLPLVAFVWLQALITARPPDRRPILTGGLVMGIVATLAALPLILFFAREPEWFFGRASIVTQVGPGMRFETIGDMYRYNARMILRVFSFEGSYDPKNGVPGVPLLDWVQTFGFIVGLAWAIWRAPRSRIARTLLVWLVVMTLPSFLTEGAPNIGRMIGIAPPTAALVALGWVKSYTWVQARLKPGPLRRALPALATLPVLASLGWHTYLLFVRWPLVPNLAEQYTTTPVELAQEMIARSETEPAFVEYLPEAEDDIAAFEFLLPGTPVARMDFRKCLPLPHKSATRTSYVVLSGRDLETVDQLLDAYEDSSVPLRDADLFQTTGTLLEVPAGAVAPPPTYRPLARFVSGITLYGFERSSDTLEPGDTLFLTLYWHATETVGEDLTAFAHVGSGLDGQPLAAQRDGQPCLGFYPTSQWRPGLVVLDSFAITLPADTLPGEYDLAVGWYSFPSLERLPLLEADHPLPDDRAVIGRVRVE
jgi:hypothetical protein